MWLTKSYISQAPSLYYSELVQKFIIYLSFSNQVKVYCISHHESSTGGHASVSNWRYVRTVLSISSSNASIKTDNWSSIAIVVDGQSFALNGRNCSYRFHVDQDSGDLISDHFGGTISEVPTTPETGKYHGLSKQLWYRREYPDLGRGDFRLPAIHIQHAEGHTVSQFQYQGHSLVDGKPRLSGLPSTFGDNGQARTLIIHLYDKYSLVGLDLSYSIFPEHNAIVRSATIINKGGNDIVVDKLASFSTDFPYAEYDVLGLRGEWARECATFRHRVQFGVQG